MVATCLLRQNFAIDCGRTLTSDSDGRTGGGDNVDTTTTMAVSSASASANASAASWISCCVDLHAPTNWWRGCCVLGKTSPYQLKNAPVNTARAQLVARQLVEAQHHWATTSGRIFLNRIWRGRRAPVSCCALVTYSLSSSSSADFVTLVFSDSAPLAWYWPGHLLAVLWRIHFLFDKIILKYKTF